MKKFKFPLEKLQKWREMQFLAEQSKLQELLGEKSSLIRLQQAIEEDRRAARAVLEQVPVDSSELRAVDRHADFTARQLARLHSRLRELSGRIDRQCDAVLEARKRVEALAHLRDTQLAAWRAELDKEQENLVAELVVARWKSAGSGL